MPTLKKLLDAILAYQAAGNSLETDYQFSVRPMIGPDIKNVAPNAVYIEKPTDATAKPNLIFVWD
jgi:hypothetical protein